MKIFVQFRDFGLEHQMYLLKLYRNLFIVFTLLLMACLFLVKPARAEQINVEKLASAIEKAENSKVHPYGILAHYKHTTPRQACINTINHALRDFDGQGDFISFLQRRYAPIGVANDPKGLNRNWTKNVKYYYARSR